VAAVAKGRPHHYVYVVELAPEVCPGTSGPCVYVGLTGLTPQERYRLHKAGHKASRYVRLYGRRLRQDLAQGLRQPMSYSEARAAEKQLAGELRRRGFKVFGAT
jgi:hypothetical protein